MPDRELDELLSEAHEALSAPVFERVSRALTVLPKLVNALDRVAQTRYEFLTIRSQLTRTVRAMREEVWEAQKKHPDVTFNAAKIQRTTMSISTQLDQLAALLNPSEAPDDDQPA